MLTTNFKDVFFLLSIIFILSLNVHSKAHSFKPEPRGGHMATLVNDRIYFFGGSRRIPMTSPSWNQTHQFNLSDEVFYLDLSSQFTVDLPPLTDLSSTSRMPFGSERGVTVLGNGGVRIFLIGGVQQDMKTFGYNATNSSFWTYNINSQRWNDSMPGTYGLPLPRRRSTATIIDKNEIIYIFGGRVQIDTGSDVFTLFDDFFTFDTLLLKWTNLSLPNHPSKRSHATATLMPDGKIIYIGGVTQSTPGEVANRLSMNEFALGNNIDPRVGHTAVLAPNNYTIVILGGTQSYGLAQATSHPVFLLLEVKSEPFQYSSPQPSGIVPPPLAYHTATLYQNYMIVAFGNITNDSEPSTNTSANIYLMNLSNYTWVTQFGMTTTTPVPNASDNTKLVVIIIPIFGGLVIIAIVGIIVWRFRRRPWYSSKLESMSNKQYNSGLPPGIHPDPPK
ncbi:galactose oxidase [Gigaspora margarita]|uniref:Galactose oxidase n=1 Tax=Gigaspora margarita TaxID=4874 RepID=A0A8H3XB86_GIGMA|nr:galactose oxidase [Gigaspora margarita]